MAHSRDRLSGSRAVCHSMYRRCTRCRAHGPRLWLCSGFRCGVRPEREVGDCELANFRNVPLRQKNTTMGIWHRFCSFTGTSPAPVQR